MDLLSQGAVENAVREVEKLREPTWERLYWELQDEGTTIFFHIEVVYSSEDHAQNHLCVKLKQTLDPLFKPIHGEYVWAVSVTHKGKCIASTFAEMA